MDLEQNIISKAIVLNDLIVFLVIFDGTFDDVSYMIENLESVVQGIHAEFNFALNGIKCMILNSGFFFDRESQSRCQIFYDGFNVRRIFVLKENLQNEKEIDPHRS